MGEDERTIADRRTALFTLPPEDFTAARDELAGELRRGGAKDAAAALGKLRRPTLAAWAVNQAVRRDPQGYDALRAAGRTLRRALRRTISGGRDADLAGAARSRRQHVQRMTERAAGCLSEAGHDPAGHREEIAATFEAASADEEIGDRVGAAQLTRPIAAPSGFGEMAPLEVAAPRPASSDEPDAVAADPPDPDGAGADEAEAAAADAEMRRRTEVARQRAEEAAEAAHRLRRDAETAAARADDAAEQARKAEADAQRALNAAAQARSHADDLRRRAEERAQEAEDATAVAQRRAEHVHAAEAERGP